jgi:ribose transport system substrate-binding protein
LLFDTLELQEAAFMRHSTSSLVVTALLSLFASGLAGCGKSEPGPTPPPGAEAKPAAPAPAAGKTRLAFVTNGVADFWTIGKAGAEKAGKDLNVEVSVIMPSNMTDQTRKVQDLITRGTDGIAISPIDPDNQGEVLDTAAAKTNLITHDSDAPRSKRLVYIGMDNYKAGYMCGKLTRDALPDGGKIMIFIGRVEQDNARRRKQGAIDGILGRPEDSTRNDDISKPLASDDGKYTVLGVMTDQFDRKKGKDNAEDAITRNPDLAAMVGLFEYNPPLCMEALERAGKLGKVKVIGFDENATTLQGIKDGTVVGTIVQNPYEYGYQSIKILNALHDGDKSVIPESKTVDITARIINKDNVDAFWIDLNAKTGKPAPGTK